MVGLQRILRDTVIIPEMLSFCDVEASFAVVVHQSSLDDFTFLRRKLDVSDEASVSRYILEADRLRHLEHRP